MPIVKFFIWFLLAHKNEYLTMVE